MFPIDRRGQDGEGNLNSLLYDSVMEGKPEKYFYVTDCCILSL